MRISKRFCKLKLDDVISHDLTSKNNMESSSSSSHPNDNSAKNKSWIEGNKDPQSNCMESPDQKESSTSMISSSHDPHKEESAPSITSKSDEKESSLASLLKRSPSGKKKKKMSSEVSVDDEVSWGDALLSSNIPPLPPGTTISEIVVKSNGGRNTGILILPAGAVVDRRIEILRTRDVQRSRALRADPEWQRELKRFRATHVTIPL